MARVAQRVGAHPVGRPERQVGHTDGRGQVLHVGRQHRPDRQREPGPGALSEAHQPLGQVRSLGPSR